MHLSRRIAATFALATTAAGLATAVAAAPVTAAPRAPQPVPAVRRGPQPVPMALRGPRPVTTRLPSIRAAVAGWVDIAWRTDHPVCDAQVQVRGERVRVDYPGNRRAAFFATGRTLGPRRPEVTRVRVTPDFRLAGDVARL
ncbi:hypothetical protein ACWT_1120 [Actinoplanes sp. SE50]|uniref:hypothetical protein n=1 Tax=unclassified Actinoplanes TaxID=2626549 RepID=UPI00023ECFC8|nr:MULTISPECIES: hypothetical protein [unclassified Actinoplanes]AEV82136.1 hypothetical protein ACPL_1239 [Actinoplanes sp. SE50/110]ATO80535.1 hypothetical protein ACWT_1120 [Actinoplanes sp. SE50]SLL97941.1 hypothetical protein ACSP50_1157 [Actinoplanes sp. SE50/110]